MLQAYIYDISMLQAYIYDISMLQACIYGIYAAYIYGISMYKLTSMIYLCTSLYL